MDIGVSDQVEAPPPPPPLSPQRFKAQFKINIVLK